MHHEMAPLTIPPLFTKTLPMQTAMVPTIAHLIHAHRLQDAALSLMETSSFNH